MVMESLQRLEPPRRLGKMALLACLGEGGMASVFVASVGDGPLARLAAVKLLRAGAPDLDYRTRFLDEAKVVVRLHHNNIVDVREAGEVAGQLYITMELIEGRDLADVWDRCAKVGMAFPLPLAVYLVREILRGLHYAHTFPGLGLVHRDISPSNILLDWAGAVRLADFGLATSAMKATMTQPGLVFGKVGYMAPEQAVRDTLDARADVYSCGVVLWELITGRPLRSSEIDTQAVADWKARPPSSLSRRVDRSLDDLVVRALAHDRDDRFDSAHTFMTALSGWLAAHAPLTTQETISDFMSKLFGNAREQDHAAYSRLLEASPRTTQWQHGVSRSLSRETRVAGPPTESEIIAPGTVLAERYKVERTLGRGGMGVVYLAEHMGVGRQVAVKVLTHEWSLHEVVAKRFKEEARAANAAEHPNIIEVYDAGRLEDGRLYMAMEHMTGKSLWEELVDCGPLDPLGAARIMGTVAEAIAAAHRVGIIHRDLKPDNVMLGRRDDSSSIRVLDFGISASAVRGADEQRLTRPGHCVGTPEYMAPEQAKGEPPAPRFDIYALGVMLYEVLSGDPPFASDNMLEVLTRKSTERAPSLAARRPGLPKRLVELCHECLEVQPELRPASAKAVADELAEIAEAIGAGETQETAVETTTEATGEATGDQSQRFPRRMAGVVAGRWRVGLGVGVTAVSMIGALLWWRLSGAEGIDAPPLRTAAALGGETPAAFELSTVVAQGGLEEARPAPETEATPEAPEAPEGPEAPEPTPAQPELDSPKAENDGVEALPDPTPEQLERDAALAKARAERRCLKARDEVSRTFKQRQYKRTLSLLGRSGQSRCWRGHRKQRTKMNVLSLFQAGKFAKCVRAGKGSTDITVKQTVSKCRQKQ